MKESKKSPVYEITRKLIEGKNISNFISKNSVNIENTSPREIMEAFDSIVLEKHDIEKIKNSVSKVLNLFYKSLKKQSEIALSSQLLKKLVHILDGVELKLEEIKPFVINLNSGSSDDENIDKVKIIVNDISKITGFFSIMENTVFPFIEQSIEFHGCLRIMWSVHDDIRSNLIKLKKILGDQFDLNYFNIVTGKIFFDIKSIIFRNRYILFPVMEKHLDLKLLDEIEEDGYVQIKTATDNSPPPKNERRDYFIDLITGELAPEQISMIFNTLPIEITFVDESSRVRFFSKPREPIFIRSKAVIGREVKKCHPPESVHLVEKILDSFRKGTRDEAEFRIEMKGKYILIRYFAVRTREKVYKGVLEVVQDITKIRKLKGEQRLLAWDKQE